MLSKASILIVEHRAAIASAIAGMLEPVRDVELLGSIPSAVSRSALGPASEPTVVIYGTGVFLPHTLTQLRDLRSFWPQAHLIAFSFDPNDESRDLALSSGADEYVSGGSLGRELPSSIQRLMSSRDGATLSDFPQPSSG